MNILYMRTQTLCRRIEKKINQKFVWLKVASINISHSTVSDSPRFICRLTALIKLLVTALIKLLVAVHKVGGSRSTATSNFINAVKRQRNLGLSV